MPNRTDGPWYRVAWLASAGVSMCIAAAACGVSESGGSGVSQARAVESALDGLRASRITRVQIDRTESPAFDGHQFGNAGQYETLVGRVFGELDPDSPLNARIVNLDRAPRNARGMVEYSSDFFILKPTDLSRGNQTLFYDVPNRGNKLGLRMFQGGGGNNPTTAADMGDAFMLNQGYTVVWSGWQGDVRPGGERLTTRFPVATNPDGSSIRRWITTEFTFNAATYSVPFEGAGAMPYPPVTESMPDAALYRRSATHAERELLPRETWSFATCDGSSAPVPSNGDVCLPTGFSPNFIYDLVYEARDPIVMGIGFAAIRDLVSFLRHDASETNPLAPRDDADGDAIQWAIVFGTSQSGRFVRDFIYQGFNEDTAGRRVFDGAIPQVAGSRRTFTNAEFAMPGRFSMYVQNHFAPGAEFPFSYATTTDPVTGRVDGLLERCRDSHTCPNIMQWDSASEGWAGRSSLVVTDPLGTTDLVLPENVRVYQFASTQHLDSSLYGPRTGDICLQAANNSNSFLELQRALLVAMQAWVATGGAPPASQHPRLSDGTLVPPHPQTEQGFPAIPGVRYTGTVNDLFVNDYETVPWRHTTAEYTVLVPRVDGDGNEIGGVRSTMTQAPLGTHTGWNQRRKGFIEGEGCNLAGSFIPFATTAAERGADPRPSLEERYGTHARYVEQVRAAAERLQRAGFLLEADAERAISAAEQRDLGLPR